MGSKFASFYFLLFLRIETFQRVMGEKHKKIRRRLRMYAARLKAVVHPSLLARPPASGVDSDSAKHGKRISGFVKQEVTVLSAEIALLTYS
jgi:hypothetical protein